MQFPSTAYAYNSSNYLNQGIQLNSAQIAPQLVTYNNNFNNGTFGHVEEKLYGETQNSLIKAEIEEENVPTVNVSWMGQSFGNEDTPNFTDL